MLFGDLVVVEGVFDAADLELDVGKSGAQAVAFVVDAGSLSLRCFKPPPYSLYLIVGTKDLISAHYTQLVKFLRAL